MSDLHKQYAIKRLENLAGKWGHYPEDQALLRETAARLTALEAVLEVARAAQTYLPKPDRLVAGRSEQMRVAIALDEAIRAADATREGGG